MKTKICQYCKKQVPEDATVCEHCGRGISAMQTVIAIIGLILGAYTLYSVYHWYLEVQAAQEALKL